MLKGQLHGIAAAGQQGRLLFSIQKQLIQGVK
jgi:hypothetical protein